MTRIVPPLTDDDRTDLIQAARGLLGRAYVHAGRTERGVDCIGALVASLGAIGIAVDDRRVYSPAAQEDDKLSVAMREHFGEPVPKEDMRAGDFVTMWLSARRLAQHVALLGEYPYGGLSVIHTNSNLGRVTEHRLDEKWRRRILEVFRT